MIILTILQKKVLLFSVLCYFWLFMEEHEKHKENKMNYSEKLQTLQWKKRAAQIRERDNYACQECGQYNVKLEVHHKYYLNGVKPWDHPDKLLVTLCEECHEKESKHRENNERKLLKALKLHFSCADIETIASAIEKMPVVNKPYIIAQTLYWILVDSKKLMLSVNRYLKDVHLKLNIERTEQKQTYMPLKGISDEANHARNNSLRANMRENQGALSSV